MLLLAFFVAVPTVRASVWIRDLHTISSDLECLRFQSTIVPDHTRSCGDRGSRIKRAPSVMLRRTQAGAHRSTQQRPDTPRGARVSALSAPALREALRAQSEPMQRRRGCEGPSLQEPPFAIGWADRDDLGCCGVLLLALSMVTPTMRSLAWLRDLHTISCESPTISSEIRALEIAPDASELTCEHGHTARLCTYMERALEMLIAPGGGLNRRTER